MDIDAFRQMVAKNPTGFLGRYGLGNKISEAAAMATDTTVEHHVLGYAAPNYSNRPLAEAAFKNIHTQSPATAQAYPAQIPSLASE